MVSVVSAYLMFLPIHSVNWLFCQPICSFNVLFIMAPYLSICCTISLYYFVLSYLFYQSIYYVTQLPICCDSWLLHQLTQLICFVNMNICWLNLSSSADYICNKVSMFHQNGAVMINVSWWHIEVIANNRVRWWPIMKCQLVWWSILGALLT